MSFSEQEKLRLRDIAASDQAQTSIAQYMNALHNMDADADLIVAAFNTVAVEFDNQLTTFKSQKNLPMTAAALAGLIGAEYLATYNDEEAMEAVVDKHRGIVGDWLEALDEEASFVLRDYLIQVREDVIGKMKVGKDSTYDLCKWTTIMGVDRFLILMTELRG